MVGPSPLRALGCAQSREPRVPSVRPRPSQAPTSLLSLLPPHVLCLYTQRLCATPSAGDPSWLQGCGQAVGALEGRAIPQGCYSSSRRKSWGDLEGRACLRKDAARARPRQPFRKGLSLEGRRETSRLRELERRGAQGRKGPDGENSGGFPALSPDFPAQAWSS